MPPKAAETSAVPRLIPAAALSAALERFLMEFLDLEALSKLRVLSKGSAALSREAVRALSFFVAPTDQLAAARAVLLLPECERLQLLDLDPTPLIGLRLHFQLRDGLPGLIVRNAGTLRRLLLPQMFASLEATRAMAQCKLLTKFRCSGLLDFEGSGFEYTRALLAVLESCPSIVDVEAHKFVPSNSMNRVVEADPRAMWGLLSNEKLRLRSLTVHLAYAKFAPLLALHTGLESLRVDVPSHVLVAATAADAVLEPPFAALGQALARLTALRALAVQMEAEDGVAAARAEPWRLPESLTKLELQSAVLPRCVASGLRELSLRSPDLVLLEGSLSTLTALSLNGPVAPSEGHTALLLRCPQLTDLNVSSPLPMACLQRLPQSARGLTRLWCCLGEDSADAAALATRLVSGLPALQSLTLQRRIPVPASGGAWARNARQIAAASAKAAAAAEAATETKAKAEAAKAGDAKQEPVSARCLKRMELHACDDPLLTRCTFPALERLDLEGPGMKLSSSAFALVGVGCPQLRELHLTRLPRLDSEGTLAAVLRSLRAAPLRQLSIANMREAGAWALSQLSREETALPQLQALTLFESGAELSQSIVEQVLARTPLLKDLNCHGMNRDEIEQLRKQFRPRGLRIG